MANKKTDKNDCVECVTEHFYGTIDLCCSRATDERYKEPQMKCRKKMFYSLANVVLQSLQIPRSVHTIAPSADMSITKEHFTVYHSISK